MVLSADCAYVRGCFGLLGLQVHSSGSGDNLSRTEMVEWANEQLSLSYAKVENLCSGKRF
jgi:hypothetical protein